MQNCDAVILERSNQIGRAYACITDDHRPFFSALTLRKTCG